MLDRQSQCTVDTLTAGTIPEYTTLYSLYYIVYCKKTLNKILEIFGQNVIGEFY